MFNSFEVILLKSGNIYYNPMQLIALLEVLSGKSLGKHNKKPNFRTHKLENVTIALDFVEKEGINLVNMDSGDIVDGQVNLIMKPDKIRADIDSIALMFMIKSFEYT